MRILYYKTVSKELLHFQELARCFGIVAEIVQVFDFRSFVCAMEGATAARETGLILDMTSLSKTCNPNELEQIAMLLRNRNAAVLLLITGVDESVGRLLQAVSSGAVQRVESMGSPGNVIFPDRSEPSKWRAFLSLSFPRGNEVKRLG